MALNYITFYVYFFSPSNFASLTNFNLTVVVNHEWAYLVAQMVKNPPAMQETWVQSLGWEDPLEEGMATHSNILAWRIPMDRGACQGYSPWGRKELDMTERLSTSQQR